MSAVNLPSDVEPPRFDHADFWQIPITASTKGRPMITDLLNGICLKVVETYEYYDEPVLFMCRDLNGQFHLVVLETDEVERKTWLLAPLAQCVYQQLRLGEIDLRDAFLGAEGGNLLRVSISRPGTVDRIAQIAAESLTDEMLPIKHEVR